MQHTFYLIGLLFSLAGMGLLDYRYKLVFWHDAKTAALLLTGGVLFFLLWDFAGIQLNIFHSAHSQYMLDVYLLPDLPPEEILFLTLLLYLPMVLSSWLGRRRHA